MQTRISDKKKPARHLLLVIIAPFTEQQSGWSAIYSDCSTRYPSLPFRPEGCQDRMCWLGSRVFIAHLCAIGALATPVAGNPKKPDFQTIENKSPRTSCYKTGVPGNQIHRKQVRSPAGQSDTDFEF